LALRENTNHITIRIYGLLLNQNKQVLVIKERTPELEFIKFPGGGLEFGEGPIECIKREFIEETGIEVDVIKHFYTTDFFQRSFFQANIQIMAIYYLLSAKNGVYDIHSLAESNKSDSIAEIIDMFWVDLNNFDQDMLNFPIDKKVLKLLKNTFLD